MAYAVAQTEWAPSRVSLAVIMVSLLFVTGLCISVGGIPVNVTGLALVSGLLTAAACALANRQRPVTRGGSSLALLGGGATGLASLALAVPYGYLVVLTAFGFVLAGFGAGLTPLGPLSTAALSRTISTASVIAVGPVLALLALVIAVPAIGGSLIPIISDLGDTLIDAVLAPTAPTDLWGTATLAVLLFWLIATALRRLPILMLLNPSEPEVADQRLATVLTILSWLVFGGGLLVGIIIVMTITGFLSLLLAALPAPVTLVVTGLATSNALRVVLVGLIGVIALFWGAAIAMKRTRQLQRDTVAAALLPAVLGIVGGVVVPLTIGERVIAPRLGQFLSPYGLTEADTIQALVPMVAVMAAIVVLLFSTLLVAGLRGLCSLSLVSERVGAVGLTSAGVLLAVFSSLGGAQLPLIVGVVAGVIVWDVGEYGIGVGEEVGRVAQSTHAELVHLGGTVLVGGLTVGVLLVLARIVKWVTPQLTSSIHLIAFTAAIAAALAFATLLR